LYNFKKGSARMNGINRTNDYAFKRIFGSEEGKEALLGFLNAVLKLPPGRELADLELIDRELDPEYLLDKAARLDVLAKTAAGTLVNIEVQIANRFDIDRRTLFYWARLYQGQLKAGQGFSELRKTITVNVLGFDWFPDERYHHVYRLREDETDMQLNDHLEIHFLELKKVRKREWEPDNPLEAWLMYLNNLEGEELQMIAEKNPAIKKALTIEEIFKKSERERRLYELREKAIRDEISMMAGAKEEGRVEGRLETKQDVIVKFMETRFKTDPAEIYEAVRNITNQDVLDNVLTKLFVANSLDEALGIISNAVN